MNVPLVNIIQIKYPEVTIGFPDGQVQLGNHSDGNGDFIQLWNVPNVEQPTNEQLQEWSIDIEVLQQYQFQQNKILNIPIIAQLEAIDLKTIRSLRENDTDRIAQFTAQAATLRASLLPTK
jgi:hypothetical protein